MKRFLALLLVLCLLTTLSLPALAESEKTERDLTPLPEEWFDKTLFFGDSITYVLMTYCENNGQLEGMQIWSEQSLSLDTAAQEDYRFWYRGEAYSLPDVIKVSKAEKVFFCLGMNDIVLIGGIDRAMGLWEKIIAAIREVNPDVHLLLQSCFPMWKNSPVYDLTNETVNEYNARMRAFCEENGCVFVDLADYLRAEDGSIAEQYSSDAYVHLTMEAAEVWARELRNPANYSVDPRSL